MSEAKKTTRVDWALRYARLKWPVIPLNGKVARTEHGSLDATLDESRIREWWKKWPMANIGIATGHEFFVLDKDILKGGDESLRVLVHKHGPLPDTIQQTTGTGGAHYLFQLPDFQVRNSEGVIAEGLDIRGFHGYIVAPPSIHPDTKRRYEFDGLEEIENQAVAAAPEWLLDRLRDHARPSEANRPQPVAEKIPKGKQHSTLVSIAGSMRRRGLSADEIFGALKVVNETRCEQPGPVKNIRKIADSVAQYAPDTRFDVFSQASTPGDESTIPLEAEPVPNVGGAGERSANWRESLILTKQGSVAPVLANAVTAFRCAPEFSGVFAFDQFSLSAVMRAAPPWGGEVGPVTDHEDRLAAVWLQSHDVLVGPETAGQALQVCSKDHCFHPVREDLEGLRWDGVKRLDDWLCLYAGVVNTPYSMAVGKRWMLSGVARIFRPGAKADCVLILEGPQGSGKSSLLKLIGGPYYTDELADMGSKDSAMQTSGVWIVELSELDALSRSEVGRTKAFVSRTVDRYRPPYGRHLIESPRQCIFAGSVNHSTYLADQTGGRRFWPVACGRILLDELARDRDQLWAEAVVCYRQGDPWWLETAELVAGAEEEQATRFEASAWDALVHPWCEDRLAMGASSVTVAEVLDGCIKKQAGLWTKADEMRVAASLTTAKWVRFKTFKGWRWKPGHAYLPVDAR